MRRRTKNVRLPEEEREGDVPALPSPFFAHPPLVARAAQGDTHPPRRSCLTMPSSFRRERTVRMLLRDLVVFVDLLTC